MMANEETTLEEMKKIQNDAELSQARVRQAEERIEALTAGTQANIDGLVVRLGEDGQVSMSRNDPPEAFTVSERQFLGLMGWGRKHIGDGPNGKSKDEPESR